MVYIIQAQEQDISYEFLQNLANVLADSPGLTHADATFRVHNSHGIFAVEDPTDATRISQRFSELGLSNFIVPALLPPPKPEPLNADHPQLEGPVELAVAAELDLVAETTRWNFSPWRMRMIYPSRIPIPGSGTEEWIEKREDTRFYLDLFTQTKHWRVRPGSSVVVQRLLGDLNLSGAYLNSGVKTLLRGERRLPRFATEEEFDKYVSWLYQLRYAHRGSD